MIDADTCSALNEILDLKKWPTIAATHRIRIALAVVEDDRRTRASWPIVIQTWTDRTGTSTQTMDVHGHLRWDD